jgi:hypothetical protein
MSDDVSEAEVIQAAIDSRWLDLHKAGPARVESYNAQASTVVVTPVLWRQIPTDDGDYVAEELPQIPDVRIAWPLAGGFGVTLPIQKGDFVLVLFCDAPLGAWRQSGQPGDPGDPERHGLSGAVAIPGVFPDRQVIADASSSNMVIGKRGTPAAQIEITPTGVNIGAGATKAAARQGDKLQTSTSLTTWAQAVETAINTLAPGSISTLWAAGAGGTAGIGTIAGGSTKVNIED